MLNFPPYKHMIPDNIVKKEYKFDEGYWHYELYDIKSKKGFKAAYMNAYPEFISPHSKYNPTPNLKKSFYISFIRSLFESKGYGPKLLKLAEHESYKQGCNGNLHLTASAFYSANRRMPHRMYTRFGFTTSDKDKLKIINKWIKKDKKPIWLNLEPTYMYYTPKLKQPQLKLRLFKLLNRLNIFKKLI